MISCGLVQNVTGTCGFLVLLKIHWEWLTRHLGVKHCVGCESCIGLRLTMNTSFSLKIIGLNDCLAMCWGCWPWVGLGRMGVEENFKGTFLKYSIIYCQNIFSVRSFRQGDKNLRAWLAVFSIIVIKKQF